MHLKDEKPLRDKVASPTKTAPPQDDSKNAVVNHATHQSHQTIALEPA